MSDAPVKLSDRLNAVLEIKEEKKKQEIIKDFVQDKDTHEDFEYTRDVIQKMVEVGKEAVEELNTIAKETQQARHYEVLATLIKTTTDNAEKMIDVRKKKKELDRMLASNTDESTNGNVTNNGTVNNNMFIGTTADLLKMIRDNQKPQTVDVTPEVEEKNK